MRLDDLPESGNVEDRRGDGGGWRRRRLRPADRRRGGLGIGTIVVLGLIGWALGIDPRLLIGGAEILIGGGQRHEQQPRRSSRAPHRHAERRDRASSSSRVLGSTEVQWKDDLRARPARPTARRRW